MADRICLPSVCATTNGSLAIPTIQIQGNAGAAATVGASANANAGTSATAAATVSATATATASGNVIIQLPPLPTPPPVIYEPPPPAWTQPTFTPPPPPPPVIVNPERGTAATTQTNTPMNASVGLCGGARFSTKTGTRVGGCLVPLSLQSNHWAFDLVEMGGYTDTVTGNGEFDLNFVSIAYYPWSKGRNGFFLRVTPLEIRVGLKDPDLSRAYGAQAGLGYRASLSQKVGLRIEARGFVDHMEYDREVPGSVIPEHNRAVDSGVMLSTSLWFGM